jgi:hypothetical protein
LILLQLKDELLLLTTGIGAACSLYCLLVFLLRYTLVLTYTIIIQKLETSIFVPSMKCL